MGRTDPARAATRGGSTGRGTTSRGATGRGTTTRDVRGRVGRRAPARGAGRRSTRGQVVRLQVRRGVGLLRRGVGLGVAGLRGLRARTWGVIAAVLVVALALGWVVYFSPWLTVQQVRLVGADRFTQAQLDAAVADDRGVPLARIDTSALAAQVEQSPAVRHAQVVRVWPDTLEVRVDERIPVGAIPQGEDGKDGYDLLAADGVTVEHVAELPDAMPVITPETKAAGEPAVRAVTTVLASLSAERRGRVVEAAAQTPDSIELVVDVYVTDSPDTQADPAAAPTPARSGSGEEGPTMRRVRVLWGSAEESALKAEVLRALLSTDADVFDVSSPRTPVTS